MCVRECMLVLFYQSLVWEFVFLVFCFWMISGLNFFLQFSGWTFLNFLPSSYRLNWRYKKTLLLIVPFHWFVGTSNVVDWSNISGRKAYMRYLDNIYKQSDISWFTPVEIFKVNIPCDNCFLVLSIYNNMIQKMWF